MGLIFPTELPEVPVLAEHCVVFFKLIGFVTMMFKDFSKLGISP